MAHSGDSDPIGAICGNFLGALHGETALPQSLRSRPKGAAPFLRSPMTSSTSSPAATGSTTNTDRAPDGPTATRVGELAKDPIGHFERSSKAHHLLVQQVRPGGPRRDLAWSVSGALVHWFRAISSDVTDILSS